MNLATNRSFLVSALFVVVLFASLFSAAAQPGLAFKRVVVNWPTVEAYFSASCNGAYVNDLRAENMRIYENGTEVKEFTFHCPDTTARCPMSVSLVFDISGSMQGAGNAGLKQAGHAFVSLMDGVTDQAAIVWFDNQISLEVPMTTDTTVLHNKIDETPTRGMTCIWDGIYEGLQEIERNAANPCKVVIITTDGGSDSDNHTPSDIIKLAQREGIRVFTVGLGSAINATDLEIIALLTGGMYYQTDNPAKLADIYQNIFGIISQGFRECLVTYQASCPDGELRTVELTAMNVCGSGDTLRGKKTYRAPKDTALIKFPPIARKGDTLVTTPGALGYRWTYNGAIVPGAYDFFLALKDTGTYRVSTLDTNGCWAPSQPLRISVFTPPTRLDIHRVVCNWPTVEAYFNVYCNNARAFHFTENNIRVFDDGAEVQDFTLMRPDTANRHPMSVSLALDISGSMQGAGNEGLKRAARAFVSLMDGTTDQAAIVWFGSYPTLEQHMTTDTAALGRKIDETPANGSTTAWDGCLESVHEAHRNGAHTNKAVILITDGGDGSSHNPPQAIIAAAQQEYVRVFTVGLGTGISAAQLEEIARLTGGKYYQTPNAGELENIYREIHRIIAQGPGECSIVYRQAPCPSIQLRPVELHAMNVCNASDTLKAAGSYRVPSYGPAISRRQDTLFATPANRTYVWMLNGVPIDSSSENFLVITKTGRYTVSMVDSTGCRMPSLPFDVDGSMFGSSLNLKRIVPVRWPTVDAYFTVTCNGTPLWDFDAGSIVRLVDNGREVAGSTFAAPDTSYRCAVSAALVLDAGFNMRGKRNTAAKSGANTFVARMDGTNDRAAYFQIGHEPYLRVSMTRHKSVLADSIDQLPASGYGDFIDAVNEAVKEVAVRASTPGKAVVALQCDGWYSPDSTIDKTVAYAQSNDIRIFTISIGQSSWADAKLTRQTGGESFLCHDLDSLGYFFERIYDLITLGSREYKLTYDGLCNSAGMRSVQLTALGGCASADTIVGTLDYVSPTDTLMLHPAIVRQHDTLVTAPGIAYQWYRSGEAIPGATGRMLKIAGIGAYSVTVTDSAGCTYTSWPYDVLSAADVLFPSEFFTLYPNPFDGMLEIAGAIESPGEVSIVVYDLLGKERMRHSERMPSGSYRRALNTASLPNGLYIVHVVTPDGGHVKRVMKK